MLGTAFDDFLKAHEVQVCGPIEVVRERPWSLVARVPTTQGMRWFKHNRGETGYEIPLLSALSQWVPDKALHPVATDTELACCLLPDGGKTLREADGGADLDHWSAMLAEHALMQQRLISHVPEMLALGVPDQRPLRIPELLDTLPIPEVVKGYVPELKGLCARLADSPIPASLQHDDLHDGNVFADGRVFDWGDAAVAHPFGVLLVTLRVAAGVFPDRPDATARLREAYLRAWEPFASPDRLRADADVAIQVAKVGRALSWRRALVAAQPEDYAEFGDPVSGWLEELLVK